MKQSEFISKILIIVCATATAAFGSKEITYDSLVKYSVGGFTDVSILTVIGDGNQLTSYCAKVNCDTSKLHPWPDFGKETVIGFIDMNIGGNRISYRVLQRIVDYGDTIVLEYKPDSQIYDMSLSLQAGYGVSLLTIPLTVKTIIAKELYQTSTNKFSHGARNIPNYQPISENFYNLQGRSDSIHSCISTGPIVLIKKKDSAVLQMSGMKRSLH